MNPDDFTEEGLSRLMRELFSGDACVAANSAGIMPILWRVTIDEFHEMMGSAIVANRLACLPTTMLDERVVGDPDDPDSTLMFDSKKMVALIAASTLTGQPESVVTITPDAALMFSDQLRRLALAMKEGSL